MAIYGKRARPQNVAALTAHRQELLDRKDDDPAAARLYLALGAAIKAMAQVEQHEKQRCGTCVHYSVDPWGKSSCTRADGLLDPLPLDCCSRWAAAKKKKG